MRRAPYDSGPTAARASYGLIISLVGFGLVPADWRWATTTLAALCCALVAHSLWRSARGHAIAFLIVGICIAGSFSLPVAPVGGVLALPFVWRDLLGNPRRYSTSTWVLGAAFVVLTATGVSAWWGVQAGVLRFIDAPAWVFSAPVITWIVVLGSAITNSVHEEILWRKLFVGAGVNRFVLVLGFGLTHINALPDGVWGVIMTAAFAYGSLWFVDRCAGSILFPVAAHIVADVAILGPLLL